MNIMNLKEQFLKDYLQTHDNTEHQQYLLDLYNIIYTIFLSIIPILSLWFIHPFALSISFIVFEICLIIYTLKGK